MGIEYKSRIRRLSFQNRELELGRKTLIMGILNVTPDSFSDGGDFISPEAAMERVREMVKEGADIIDIGGESSRPGHERITEEEELRRVIPVIRRIREESDILISLDTIRSRVAEEALKAGANIINDIWGLQLDRDMAQVAMRYEAPVVVMHNQDGTEYDEDIVDSIKGFFRRSIDIADRAGLRRDLLILDPGFGFGKTARQNLDLMPRISELLELDYPILLGTSRKSMINMVLNLPPKERVEGTIATTVLGIVQGVDMVRVHDVLENARAAAMTDACVRR
ncbi:dihydropteroate synthase [Youngiibacter fragilis]|uniref:Dihydropteroate synthase n=1 Tax=Youngiibacter fragilis 232.1 TaxID=994573 RepID=V7I6B7_9CLOT|nr:dihydropteroate synthase [Youngiibacter fragilis]ETA80841.1 dihydropteroate synthase [Youngiibacter fragilis 232.1]